MLKASWPKHRKIDLNRPLKSSYNLRADAIELLRDIFGDEIYTAEGDNILIEYLPEVFYEIADFIFITEAESTEINTLRARIQQLLDNSFVDTSDEQAVARREKPLKIRADLLTETLRFRKRRLLNRYQTKPPFTRRWLQRQLDRLVGPGLTVVTVDHQNRTLIITAKIDDANVFNEVQHTIHTVKPANMIYQHNTATGDVIGLEERISKKNITWNYKLDGSWGLGDGLPFASFGDEEVIK